MPGTTRYSATFDRTYEEDDRAKPASPPNARRSRSQSWQANSGLDGRQYTPFASRSPAPRSSSSDNNPSKGTEYIPTRTAKTSVKAHNNPFQFVKVGTCPLYKKAEEQLKKVKEVKKPDVLKEEEEEWQTNLDSWKSRRRKMSEDVFRRQEELKLLELEEQIAAQVSQKKTKTFSEMVESRATRGRALSLCLLTSPLEFQNWEFENKSHKNGSCSFTDESGENSTVNSEDEGVSVRGRLGETSHNGNEMNHRTNGNAHIEQNGSKLDASNGECNKLSNNVQTKPKENSYIDSGLESISSSHRAGDTPDSGSDFSQDSNSSIDCDSPRTGVNLLEDFSSKSSQISEGLEITASLKLDEKGHDFGFTFLGGKDEGQVIISSILEGSKAESSDIHLGDRIITIDGCDVSSKKHIEIAALLQKGREKGQINLILLRSSSKSISGTNGFATTEKHNKVISKETLDTKTYEKSIESENEMYVDDFEEIKRQSELLALNKKTDTASKNAQAQTKENKSPNKDAISLKLLSENSTAPILKINESNSAVEDTDKNEQKTEINNENRPKNIVKVKRIRRKGVYALNVDSNQISQDGIPINSLFPLSPVTELPSPADETKTMCSSLSSKNTLTVSVTQNGISNEEKQNDTLTSANISVIQGENIVSPTLKSESSVSHSTNLKTAENVESKMQTNIESKTETAKDPSLSSKTTNSLTEKSKSVSTPKKVKSTKLKKEITSEKTTTSSENMKELTNPVLSNHVAAVKTVTQEKTSSELINNKLSNVGNDEENCTVSKSMGNTAVKNPSNASTDTTLNEIYSSKKQNSTFQTEKQEKTISKNETTVPPLAEENCNSSNEITDVLQPLKTLPEKDETFTTCPSSNKVRDLALKFGEKKSSFSSESPSSTKNAKPPKIFLSEKSKPSKLDSTKVKANSAQQISTVTAPVVKKTSLSSASSTSNMLTKNADKEIKTKTGKADSVVNPEKQPKIIAKNQTAPVSIKRDNSDGQVPLDSQPVVNKLLTSSVSNTSDSCSSNSLIKEIQSKKEKVTTAITQDKQAKTVAKNENKMCPLNRDKDIISLATDINVATAADKVSDKLLSVVVPSQNATSMTTADIKSESNTASPEISLTENKTPKSLVCSLEEKPKNPKRSRNRSKKKNANSQKVNTTAKLNEECKNSNDSINIVFQSQPKNTCFENLINNNVNFENNSNKAAISTDLVTDVPPVDKIAEEMEKLILEQLEEEERRKELSSGKISLESSPEHLLTAPPRLAEPPKEKPPPPPSSNEGSPKDSSLKRVNSTKRIKKEIYKRRSNFLGIDNADESIICNESSVPPPPALEEILRAEMELDRQTRLKIENESTERLTLEEKEIMQREREIIESLESEERQKMILNGIDDCNNVFISNTPSQAISEQDRIESLKYERKRIDTDKHLSDEQQQILLDEKQLKEREEFIRQQEAAIPPVSLTDHSLSVSAKTANNLKQPALSSLPTEVHSNELLLGAIGDGNDLILSSSVEISNNEISKSGKKSKPSEKPAVPPKPLKKKEAIRKERERLRQEQEALQREREEHRRKLMLEQEELMKQQKSHAPDAPVSRLGPHPPHVQPSLPSQLITTTIATPNARENASFPSRSHHGTSNGPAGNMSTVELTSPPVARQNRVPAPRKVVQNETWEQQKIPSVRKQNHESLTESRYNQNHWLIQEAEMRRITEFKERQRTTQPPNTQTHLAEDDVCSNPSRVPVILPTHNPQLNYPGQEKIWKYGQSNMPVKKYPPPVVKEPPLHTIYSRETISQQPPTKPSRVVPSERQEQMLSVSGRKRCSHCNEELGRGAAMIIESLQLYYHIHCFQCCVCQAQLGNGSCGTDVRVRNNKLHCHNCYSNDEAGLKFSQV